MMEQVNKFTCIHIEAQNINTSYLHAHNSLICSGRHALRGGGRLSDSVHYLFWALSEQAPGRPKSQKLARQAQLPKVPGTNNISAYIVIDPWIYYHVACSMVLDPRIY